MKRTFSILILVIVATVVLQAQKFTASVTRTKIAVGEQFEIQFTYSGTENAKGFKPPALTDFDILFGPSQSVGSQWINGSFSQSISFGYLLLAKKEGTFTIGPANIMVNGNKLESNSITIEVAKGQQQQGGNQNNSQQQVTSSDNLFAITSVSKQKAYLGEMISVSHKVYSRLSLKGFQDASYPAYNGFWSQEAPRPVQYEVTTENVDGFAYSVVELKRTFLFAQRTGTLEIEPLEVECIVREKSKQKSNNFWNQFWGMETYRDAVYKIKSKSVKIEVKALPEEEKPAGFNNIVGNYTMKAEINKTEVKANEGVNLKITISGKGNLKLIEAPKLGFPSEFETFDAKLSDKTTVTNSGVAGSKTYDYLLIPRKEGEYKIDSWNMSFFDPEKKTYITLQTPEFGIKVLKDNNARNSTIVTSVAKEDVKMMAEDIKFIKTGNIELHKKGEYFYNSPGFYASIATPPLLFFLLLFARRRYQEQNKDLLLLRQRKANAMARKRLSIAEKLLKEKKSEEFFAEVHTAIYGYLGDKLRIPLSEMNKELVKSKLNNRGVNEELNKRLIDVIETCEFARYAPSGDAEMNKMFEDAVYVIVKLEDILK